MDHQTDHEKLLRKIQDNQRIIYKIANSYCSNKYDREDLRQEMVYQLIKSYHTFNPAYPFSTWMYRVALNVTISFYRKSKNANHVKLVDQYEKKKIIMSRLF